MADEAADNLREMAQHRGFKLVRSRRRKPGAGDFGKFGLTDDKGKPLLGISEDGFTASAEDIEAYLREGAVSTWQQSAELTPDRPGPRSKRQSAAGTRAGAGRHKPDAERSETGAGRSASRKRGTAAPTKLASLRSARAAVPRSNADAAEPAPDRDSAAGRKASAKKPASASREQPQAGTRDPVAAAPKLVLRSAKPADVGALVKLLEQLRGVSPSPRDVARELAAMRKAGGGVHVAELGSLVGCVAWAVVATLQRGPVGRITVLVVDADHRRQGLGTQLLAAAEAALVRKGCALVEAISDIDLRNAHNFFRTLKFTQTSYRFTRTIAQ